jgi:hypothetical protein
MRPVRKRSTAFSGRSTSSPASFGGTRSAPSILLLLMGQKQKAGVLEELST